MASIFDELDALQLACPGVIKFEVWIW
jgi:hypothetical protein